MKPSPATSIPYLNHYAKAFQLATGFGLLAALVSAIARQKFSFALGLTVSGLGFLGNHFVKQIKNQPAPQPPTLSSTPATRTVIREVMVDKTVETAGTFSLLSATVSLLAGKSGLEAAAIPSFKAQSANATDLLNILSGMDSFLTQVNARYPLPPREVVTEKSKEEPDPLGESMVHIPDPTTLVTSMLVEQ